MAIVSLICESEAQYPRTDFNPGVAYPEYPFTDAINPDGNSAYEMVRACLHSMGLDEDNFGTPKWNPLKEYLRPGQTAVIKPNWVMHENENRKSPAFSMECLVTHPSIVRAICDYCFIALQGHGLIVVGDAPMQSCHLDELLEKMNYGEILSFYDSHELGAIIRFEDFRAYATIMNTQKVIVKKLPTSASGTDVSIGRDSAHYLSGFTGHYQVSDYDRAVTTSYHHDDVHTYSITKSALMADLVIGIPKPKCHRLAGMTSAMKNMVGIAYRKETLPHRKGGSSEEGGDACLHKSIVKKAIDAVLTQKVRFEDRHLIIPALGMRYLYGVLYYASKVLCKDPYLIGSWYGNDTIWRTCVDLNYIMTYADKSGSIQGSPQRKTLHIADMLIAGQHNGPVSPDPKELGLILGSEDAASLDAVVCRIMGFSFDDIPMMRHIINGGTFLDYVDPRVVSNDSCYTGSLSSLAFPVEWTFEPHDSWKSALVGSPPLDSDYVVKDTNGVS